jgi:hypothetical protein
MTIILRDFTFGKCSKHFSRVERPHSCSPKYIFYSLPRSAVGPWNQMNLERAIIVAYINEIRVTNYGSELGVLA